MTGKEFSNQFDVLYNNISSNQAPGLNEYEKSLFLTKAQDEIIKNYFLPQSNPKQAGYDGNQKRQMDFSLLMKVKGATKRASAYTGDEGHEANDYAFTFNQYGTLYELPGDLFIPINEELRFVKKSGGSAPYTYTLQFQRQVIPLSYEEYTRLMSKPYKEPLKDQAWRLLVNDAGAVQTTGTAGNKLAEIIIGHNDYDWVNPVTPDSTRIMQYIIRYIRRPRPIIITYLGTSVSINSMHGNETEYDYNSQDGSIGKPCELDASLHEEILQRAVELAKIAWQGDLSASIQTGQRSE